MSPRDTGGPTPPDKMVEQKAPGKEEIIRKRYEGAMTHLSDHVLDQLMADIERTGIKPTEDQSRVISEWLDKQIKAPEWELDKIAREMEYPMDNPGEALRQVYRDQLERFSELVGVDSEQ